jgi:hypothetical protein
VKPRSATPHPHWRKQHMRQSLVLMILLVACVPAMHIVESEVLPVTVAVGSEFRHVGTQRFTLRDRTSVEQHLFFDAEDQRILWIQFERLLPNQEGSYDYARDDRRTIGGTEFAVQVRQYDSPPEPDSDRGHAQELLASRGLTFPPLANRVRLVHVPDHDGRSELMIVYAEKTTDPLTDEEVSAITERALRAIGVRGGNTAGRPGAIL